MAITRMGSDCPALATAQEAAPTRSPRSRKAPGSTTPTPGRTVTTTASHAKSFDGRELETKRAGFRLSCWPGMECVGSAPTIRRHLGASGPTSNDESPLLEREQ